jgi:8-oxo-dGTP diphosphatase
VAESAKNDSIRAAGGIVWRDWRRREVVVIYRDRHSLDECCLPKGKLEPGEDWERAALREVLEETGCEAEIRGFAGLLHYFVGRRPKVVVYFEMVVVREGGFQPSREVRETAWLTPRAAVAALTHQGERGVVSRCLPHSEP